MTKWRPVGRLMATVVVAVALTVIAGAANAFQASTTFSEFDLPQDYGLLINLPKYSGPGTITNVVLSVSGITGGLTQYFYILSDGITVPSAPASWDVALRGPDIALVADAPIHSEFVGVTIPPCTDPICQNEFGQIGLGPTATPFFASGSAGDLSDFAGTGFVQVLLVDSAAYEFDRLTGTVTETITASVPEPSAWFAMLFGFGLIGAALRKSRASLA